MLPSWQAPHLPDEPVEIFIGILSAGNHFAERMAARKTWMSAAQKSSNVVARFFVALVNLEDQTKSTFFFYGLELIIFLFCSMAEMRLMWS